MMGIVSDEDFELDGNEVTSSDKKEVTRIPSANVEEIKRGRAPDTKEVPSQIREAVARATINGEGTHKQIAETYSVSPSSVSAYAVGAHSTSSYHSPNSSLSNAITDHKARISNKARNRLLSALNNITSDKLANAKVRDLAAIAKDMSGIVQDMEPQSPSSSNSSQSVQFVFMSPKVKDIEDYKIIDVNDA